MNVPLRSSLRFRLILLVFLAAIPSFLLIIYSGMERLGSVSDAIRDDAVRTAERLASEQERLILRTRQLLTTVSRLPQIRSGVRSEAEPMLKDLLKEYPIYANIGLIGRDGKIIASALPFDREIDLSFRSYFTNAVRTGQFAIGEYQVGLITGVPSINFGLPVTDRDGSVGSVVFSALPLTWIGSTVKATWLPEGYLLEVIDSNGTVLARYPDNGGLAGKASGIPGVKDLVGRIEGAGPLVEWGGTDGERRIYALSSLGAPGRKDSIYVLVGLPSSGAYAAVKREIARNVATLVGIFAVTLAVAWVGSDRLFIRRVKDLLEHTRRVRSGDLSARVEVPQQGCEFRELAEAVNSMTATLEARKEEEARHLGRIARLNRVYAVLSGINGVLIRVRDREKLLEEACRIAVKEGNFVLAWVGFPEGGALVQSACSGRGCDPLSRLRIPLGRDPAGRDSLVNRAFRSGEAAVSQGPGSEAFETKAGVEDVIGYRSAAAFPLKVEEEVKGVLLLFASEEDFYDTDEMRLLRELAADTSLGLEHIENTERLDYLVNYDSLTGLPNRLLFLDRLDQSIRRASGTGKYAAVVVLDINGFRRINDTLGHSAGDEVLRHVSRCLTGALRDGDTVARLGSDDFGIILSDVADREDVVRVVGKLQDAFPERLDLSGEPLFVSARLGVSVYPGDGDDARDLIKSAELALHADTGETSSTSTFYSRGLNAMAHERRRVENGLRHALDESEFVLHYQPIIDVRTSKTVSFEALMRWKGYSWSAGPELRPGAHASILSDRRRPATFS